MKNINSKSFKQYQVSSNKRSISPLLTSQHQVPIQSNSNNKSAKKKIIANSPYQKVLKEFDTSGKGERKKTSNNIEQSKQLHNKYRIVTQPVDDRIMHLAQSNIFNSSLAIKQTKKIEAEIIQPSSQIRLNIRQQNNSQSRSRDRLHSKTNLKINREDELESDMQEQRSKSKDMVGFKCKNCTRYTQQFQYLSSQVKKLMKTKQLWKSGQISYSEAQQVYTNSKNSSLAADSSINLKSKMETKLQKQRQTQDNINSYYHNSIQTLSKEKRNSAHNIFKFADSIINQIKFTMAQLTSEIQALAFIDYPKMLQMQIFKYQPTYSQFIDVHEAELKELFGQLRMSVQGKITDYDTYDTESQNNYVKMVMRNMKSRLSSSLRQNLQLRIYKAIYQKSQQISQQSEQYLRKVIEQVLINYTLNTGKRQSKQRTKEKQRQKERQKQKLKSSKK